MKFTHRAEYHAAPDAVFAQMCDQEFQDAKCDATTNIGWETSVSTSPDRTVISTERVLSTEGLPDVARSFVGESLTILEVQTWGAAAADGSRTADLNLHVKGAPMTVKGTIRLTATANGSVHEIDAELRAGVPLIGGRLEKAAYDPIMFAARTETELLHQRLG